MSGMRRPTGLVVDRVVRLTVERRTELLLFVVAFAVFVLTASRGYMSFDVWSSNYASWRLATHGSPFIDGVSVPPLDDHPLRWVWVQDAPNGHTVITRAPGVVVLGLPAYWLSQPDSMTVLPASITAAALIALAVLFMFLALRTVLRRRWALWAAVAFGFTTPVWSVAADGIWPHTLTVLGISILAWSAATQRWWVMGIGGALMLSARPNAAVIVAVLGLALAWRARRLGIAVRVGTPGVVALVMLSAWTHWVYGSWSPTPLFGAGAFADVHNSIFDVGNQFAMWIAPDRGIFVYTPVLLVILPTLVRRWRVLPDWTRILLLAGLGYTLAHASMAGFTGGDPIYGYRYGLEFVACAAPAFAVAAGQLRGLAQRLLVPVLALQFVIILVGAVDEQSALPSTRAWVDNAFLQALVDNSPALPAFGVLVVVVALLVERRVRRRSGESGTAPGTTRSQPAAAPASVS